ncbi:MAG TPA: enoyl-CoA hydratase/isomerase family protein [Terriglobia bacterium]|nr:enoyl-CoA hydratase/isomerase family protein [Terriglobia bacterium]
MDFQSQNSIAILAFRADDLHPRLDSATLDELTARLEEIRRSNFFRGLVIASSRHSFATGAEIEEIAEIRGFSARRFAARGQELLNSIARFPVPVVAAIRGFCLGGGFDLALACHARVATFDSSFGHPGGALGLMTGWGGTQRLPRMLGKPAALQILLTGERIPATQALSLGLVDELVASKDLTERSVLHAERLGTRLSTSADEGMAVQP